MKNNNNTYIRRDYRGDVANNEFIKDRFFVLAKYKLRLASTNYIERFLGLSSQNQDLGSSPG